MNIHLNDDLARVRREELMAEAQRYRQRAVARQGRSHRRWRRPRWRTSILTPAPTPQS